MKISSILKVRDVKKRVGMSRSMIYLQMADGLFPKNIKIGKRAMGWLDSEIQQWIDDRVKERDA